MNHQVVCKQIFRHLLCTDENIHCILTLHKEFVSFFFFSDLNCMFEYVTQLHTEHFLCIDIKRLVKTNFLLNFLISNCHISNRNRYRALTSHNRSLYLKLFFHTIPSYIQWNDYDIQCVDHFP